MLMIAAGDILPKEGKVWTCRPRLSNEVTRKEHQSVQVAIASSIILNKGLLIDGEAEIASLLEAEDLFIPKLALELVHCLWIGELPDGSDLILSGFILCVFTRKTRSLPAISVQTCGPELASTTEVVDFHLSHSSGGVECFAVSSPIAPKQTVFVR